MNNIENWLMLQSKVVTRAGICPFISARGSVSLAELRTHLFNYIITRYFISKGGQGVFNLRCDDTDETTTDTEFMPSIVSMFIEILETKPDLHPYNSEKILGYPLIQSKRKKLYEKYIANLCDANLLYKKNNNHPLIFSVKKFIEINGSSFEIEDLLLGKFFYDLLQNQRIHDFPITRRDGSSLWHLCSVVDDFNTEVNLVVRAQDKIGNIPYQEMLRLALKFPTKTYIHLPLMRADHNTAGPLNFLSTVHEFMEAGITSRAIIIYLCASLFAISDYFKHLRLNELILDIKFSNLIKSPNHFDLKKLLFVNKTLNSQISKCDYLAELDKCARSDIDKDLISLLANPINVNLLLDLRFDYTKSKTILKKLLNPIYSFGNEIKIQEINLILNKLEENISYKNLFLFIRNMIDRDKTIIPILRWILMGERNGISIIKILNFLEISKVSINDRIKKAKNVISNYLKDMAIPINLGVSDYDS